MDTTVRPTGLRRDERFDVDKWLKDAGELRVAVALHVVKHIGKVETVAHMVDDNGLVPPVDMLVVWPTPQRPYVTVVSAGASERAQEAPDEVADFRRLEFAVSFHPDLVPPDWAVESLWYIAVVMHAGKELVVPLDTFSPHPSEADCPVIPGTKYGGFLISFPRLYGQEFGSLQVGGPDAKVKFLSLLAVYPEELSYQRGQQDKRALFFKLLELGDVEQVEVVRADRASVARKRFWLF